MINTIRAAQNPRVEPRELTVSGEDVEVREAGLGDDLVGEIQLLDSAENNPGILVDEGLSLASENQSAPGHYDGGICQEGRVAHRVCREGDPAGDDTLRRPRLLPSQVEGKLLTGAIRSGAGSSGSGCRGRFRSVISQRCAGRS